MRLKSADAAIVRIKKIRALGQRRTRKHDYNGHIWTTQPKTHLTQAVISTHVCKHAYIPRLDNPKVAIFNDHVEGACFVIKQGE